MSLQSRREGSPGGGRGRPGCLHLQHRCCQPPPLMTPASVRPVSTRGNERGPLRCAQRKLTVTPPPLPPPPHPRPSLPPLPPPRPCPVGAARLHPFLACTGPCFAEPVQVVQTPVPPKSCGEATLPLPLTFHYPLGGGSDLVFGLVLFSQTSRPLTLTPLPRGLCPK